MSIKWRLRRGSSHGARCNAGKPLGGAMRTGVLVDNRVRNFARRTWTACCVWARDGAYKPMPDEVFVAAGRSCAATPKAMLKSPESVRSVFMVVPPNDKSSATRRTGRDHGHRDTPAGFAAAHG